MRVSAHILKRSTSKYVTYPKFVFLCGKGYEAGKYDVSNRGVTGCFLKKLLPDTHIVLSEKLWEERFDGDIDLLIFEEFLAEISDAIILFVESPGSFVNLVHLPMPMICLATN